MSAEKLFQISCDGPGCRVKLNPHRLRPAQQRQHMKRHGWESKAGDAGGEGGEDLCPACAAAREKKLAEDIARCKELFAYPNPSERSP